MRAKNHVPVRNRTVALGEGALTRRNIAVLVSTLVAAKVAVLLGTILLIADGNVHTISYLLSPQGFVALIHGISTDWDSVQYELIARSGYNTFKGSELYAFSPLYPVLIYVAHFLTGSYWTAALLVTNALSFVFPVLVLRLFGLRPAILAETFPVYVVFSMIAYSDVLALLLLSLGLLLYVERRYLLAGLSLGLAGLVFYDLLVAGAVFLVYTVAVRQDRAGLRRLAVSLVSLVLPVFLAGAAMLLAYWNVTGNPLLFLELEHSYWGVASTTPVGQVQWLFSGKGVGSFTGMFWYVYGLKLSSAYWAVRNLAFEAFFFLGIYLLTRTRDYPYRWLLVGYSLLLSVPLLFVEGTPVYSIPRLLLAAFPVFFGYSETVITRNWRVLAYVAASLLAACWVLLTFTFAFFA
ncbi:MAG: hypothetical protein JRN09_09165 [Nitrososphaerota archaeon]|nr:hypothetical protein [Nitrososphaerota archaeon]